MTALIFTGRKKRLLRCDLGRFLQERRIELGYILEPERASPLLRFQNIS